MFSINTKFCFLFFWGASLLGWHPQYLNSQYLYKESVEEKTDDFLK